MLNAANGKEKSGTRKGLWLKAASNGQVACLLLSPGKAPFFRVLIGVHAVIGILR
jgi:hypothetical protein